MVINTCKISESFTNTKELQSFSFSNACHIKRNSYICCLLTDYPQGYPPSFNRYYPLFINIIMSDGNFNRQLLPKTELSSGLRAGKAQMRVKAERAFDEVVNDFILNENELKEAMKKRFMELLRQS